MLDPRPSAHPPARPAARPDAWRRVLAIRLDNAGDVVMLGPSLRALRRAAPKATVTLLASRAGAAAAPLLPWIDDVIVERAPWQDASGGLADDAGHIGSLVERLREIDVDAAFVFTSFSQTAWPPAFVAYLAGIPFRAGQAADFGGSILTRRVPPLADQAHQVDRNAHLLEGVGIPVLDRRLEIAIPADAVAAAAQLRSDAGIRAGEPYLVAAVGASCAARRVSPRRVASALAALSAETGWRVLAVGGDREVGDAAELERAVPGCASLAGRTTLPELAALVRDAGLLVTAHSLPMHLADATGTPMVVAFSGTDLESQWRPRVAPAVLLRRPTACAPCHRFDCPYDTACLDIDARDIVAAGQALLALDRPDAAHTQPIPQKEHDEWIACAS